MLVDSLSYLVSGVLTASVRVQETVADAEVPRDLRREIGDSVRWVYWHRVLTLAITTH